MNEPDALLQFIYAEMPLQPFKAAILTPVDASISARPSLSVTKPSGVTYDYVLNMGLMWLHERPGCVAEIEIDELGEWSYAWQGMQSRTPLHGVIEVLPMPPATVLC